MKYRFLHIILALVIGLPSFSQDISRQEADSLIKALKKSDHGINRISLLLNLAQFHIFKPGELEIDFDSAKTYINEAKELNRTLKSAAAEGYTVLTQSYITKEKGDKEEGKKLAEKAVAILKTGNNNSFLGNALFELSMYYNYQDSIECGKRIELVNQAINAFDKVPDFKGKGRALEMLGDLYIGNGKAVRAIPFLKLAHATYDSIKYPKQQGVYVLLATAYFEQFDYGQALFYSLKALKSAQLLKDTSMQVCQIYNQLGRVYQELGKFEMALKYMRYAFEVAHKNNDVDAVFVLVSNMSSSYHEISQSDQALKMLAYMSRSYLVSDNNVDKYIANMCYLRAHNQLKQFGDAAHYLDIVLKLADKKLIPVSSICNSYKYAADYYAGIKQFSKSRYYLTKSMQIAERSNLEYARMRGLRLAYELDSAQGDFRSANKYLLMYKAKTDSVSSERTARQFQVLNVEYEVGMKEDSIKLKNNDISLLKQTNSLQEANLRQESLVKNVTIGGIILAAIIIGLLYRQYSNKRKSNTIITRKNEQLQHFLTEKEWLLKEIHHRVKNNLQIVMSLLNSQSAYIENDAALTAIHDSQHRVHAMSLIHQKLYNTENVSSIDMSLYIRELAFYLRDSYNTGQRIRFEFDIETLELDVSQAVPLGLILNEGITNSIKYAFPENGTGVINISLSHTELNHYLLSISDNGIGMPAQSTVKKQGSLGMSLMEGLSEDIDGRFTMENNNGTTIKISFIHDINVKRPDTFASPYISINPEKDS